MTTDIQSGRIGAPEALPLCLKTDAACKALSVGKTTLFRLMKEGKLKAIKIGGCTLIPRLEIERVIREAQSEASNKAA